MSYDLKNSFSWEIQSMHWIGNLKHKNAEFKILHRLVYIIIWKLFLRMVFTLVVRNGWATEMDKGPGTDGWWPSFKP